MKALLLGAGASYESGMPLVWEFTNILRMNVLKRLDTYLFDFRKEPSFRSQFEGILSNPNLHYEQMVGELEAIYLARGNYANVAYDTLRQLVDCVQILLLEDQMHTTNLLREKAKDYTGIKVLAGSNPCLHVFSLNHDLNFEEICKHHGVPCRDGFFDTTPTRYANIAKFHALTKEQMDAENFNFFPSNEFGVNLIKLHGSIDVFAVEDKKLYLKCVPPQSERIGGHVQEVIRAEKHSHAVCAGMQSRTVGELNVLDAQGELQFLRRSLLSGAHKFKGHFDQIAPLAFFNEFNKRMTSVTELDVIGYGFGDVHVNAVIAEWIDGDVHMNIFDPHRKVLPIGFESHEEKVSIINVGLTDYFRRYDEQSTKLLPDFRQMALQAAREHLRKRREAVWNVDSKPAAG